MANIFGQLSKMVEIAIEKQRRISVCIQHQHNYIMSSFVPSNYDYSENGFHVTDGDYSLSLDEEDCIISYDPIDEEFVLTCENVKYYLALI